ncbi:hypothetical protein HPB48_006248 [Haemaphysalis longicornis]|uniref:Uncharacterized protein n=1 Tax=Haemaphysalis longicornis TaxID=44386 RepID=A0A9J6GQ47_HAELO|nr:hypothetical protein HPB48_006248 [Haemaphysalis longicornis]
MMAKRLGCHIHVHGYEELKTSFASPLNDQEVIYMILNACHGINLLRNLLGDKGVLISSTYGVCSGINIY